MGDTIGVTRQLQERLRVLAEQAKRSSNDVAKIPNNFWKTAFADAVNEVLPEVQKLLLKLATEAAVDTEEFADKLFTSRLEKAINVDDIYTFRANGQGQVTTVKIDLASSAGNLEDYFNAVELLREEMGWGDSDPRNASLFWRALDDLAHGVTISSPILRKKIKRGMWKETVRLRIGHYSELAPFWELIDKGNIGIGHGRGGKPHPYYGPSHFLESATVQAKVLFTAEYEKRKANLKAALERDSYGLKDFIQSFPGVFRGQPIRQVS